ncbi:protein piccolo-like [Scleropages formosus]|uniref:protein piccolo-like n=1 Tax=Scleropages formosus TaxID=113540 RepID=UPI0010FA9DC5|nr:protein piccolo-like [Scleropages formosus]
MGAVDLTTTKPVQTVTSIKESTSQVITSVAEEDGKPVDLTGICTAPQPATTLPEDRFGYRDDHYQYGRVGLNGTKGLSGLKPSMSDTNLAEAGFFWNGFQWYDTVHTDSTKPVVPTVTAIPGAYIDGSLETIAAPLQALPASVLLAPEGSKDQQYQMERELLELEKVKQLRMAEEIEWERQEIQRFREQEQLIVQQELEKLQTMKQQLLHQQEEERQAHLIMQQETYAQHQLQLEQIHHLQQQLQLHLEEQKMRQIYGYDPSETVPPLSSSEQISQEQQYLGSENGQFWPVQDDTAVTSVFTGFDFPQKQSWLPVTTQGVTPNTLSVPRSELSGKESKGQECLQLSNQVQSVPGQHDGQKKIDSGVQTDGEDIVDRAYAGRRRRSRKSVDSSVQTDDEDQDGWDVPARSRRRSRSTRYVDGEKGKQASKLSSIAIQTVAEISVQTDPSGSLKRPSVRAHVDTKVELSSPEKPHRGSSFSSERKSPQRDKKRPTPLEISYTTHLKADSSSLQVAPSPPKSPKVLYSPISPLSPRKALEYASYEKSIQDSSPQKITAVEPSKTPPKSPRAVKGVQRPTLESKTSSPAGDEQSGSNLPYSDGYLGKSSQSSTPSGTQKKVKRTLPNPPQEEESAGSQASYSTGSARRRLCRNTTMARVKILQDIDRELDLVERESSKLRQKQAELDEEEKEIDARLRYLEMGINRRRDALLKEREKRERDYLQGVAEERDYMSDSEVSNIREKRGDSHGLERPKTAPQSELNKFIPPQTQPTSPYTQYQYATPTQAPQQTLYQQSSFYECQQTSPYQSIYSSVPTPSYPQGSHQHSQPRGYQHTSQTQMIHQKPRQTALSDLEPKITTNYEVTRNQPAMTGPSSADTMYGLPHLGGKYSNLNIRMGLDERGSVASSPMSSVSADSIYADIDHHTPKNYLLFNDMGEITKGSTALSSTFSIPDKDIAKADRLLRAAEMRDYLGPLQASLRLHPCMKVQEDAMEEPYELKLLKQQIKQEFRRGADGLDPLTGLHHYYPSDSNYRHFHKAEKYSIGRLTLEKQAAKQLPASVLYQKQAKHRKSLIDPKITKFSPIQESRDIGLDYSSYLTPSTPQVSSLASRARLLQDDITFGLRKSITEQQKYLGSTLGSNIAQSFNLGQSLNLSQHLRSSLQDDTTYPSGSRSRPSSRPSSVYGLDLSIKRDLSSSSLRLRMESDGTSLLRTKPTNLPISQSRGRIPIVSQNSEEESPLSPVGQPMGMARASAGPLPPISADLRDQFGSSHSLPEVQQHMREESRARAYDRDMAFLMDDIQGVVPDSEAAGKNWNVQAYHLRQEETDWFDKPRETCGANGLLLDRKLVSHKQMRQHGEIKPSLYPFPHTRVTIQRDPKDRSVSGNGLGLRVLGGKEIPGNTREMGAYVASVVPGGAAEQTGKIVEGMQILEWNGVSLTGKTYEEVQGIVSQPCGETEICVRLDLNMLSDPDHPQCLELQDQSKPGPAGDRQKSPGVDPNQLAAELQKVSQQQAPSAVASSLQEKGLNVHSSATLAASSVVHSSGHPGSPSVNKKRQSSKPAEAAKIQTHPITGDIQLQLNYDRNVGNLIVHVLQARNLAPRDNNGYSDPFVKVYLLPGRSQVMVVQNASAENKRRSKSSQRSLNPEWNQTVIYKNIHLEQLKKKTLEVTVWDYDRSSSNDFLGEVLIELSNTAQLDNLPRWFPLKEQGEILDHGRPRSGQGIPQPPKPSVIKSRSHGIFPDPSKDMQLPTIEKSHSSPGSSKSSSETHLRSHGPSRSQSKGSVTQTHLEDAGVAIAAAEAAVQQHRYQPTRPGHRPTEASVKTVPAVTNLNLEEEGGADAVDSAIFQVPQIGKAIPNGTDKIRGLDPGDNQGKTQVMGEIKIALKKETKTEGEQLIVEILQCRNITFKFKSPDHLPDLYVKLYVVNVATQKKLIKKKTRVCRHDREPSFNETFRFTLNPTGHSLQLFLVSNGGKFVKKTLVGEAYVWLDKVDLRKRTTSWHKLLASSPQGHP